MTPEFLLDDVQGYRADDEVMGRAACTPLPAVQPEECSAAALLLAPRRSCAHCMGNSALYRVLFTILRTTTSSCPDQFDK